MDRRRRRRGAELERNRAASKGHLRRDEERLVVCVLGKRGVAGFWTTRRISPRLDRLPSRRVAAFSPCRRRPPQPSPPPLLAELERLPACLPARYPSSSRLPIILPLPILAAGQSSLPLHAPFQISQSFPRCQPAASLSLASRPLGHQLSLACHPASPSSHLC